MKTLFCLLLLACVLLAPAQAYTLLTKSGSCPNGFVFAADPAYGVNTSLTADRTEAAALISAVGAVMDRFNLIGGQKMDFVTPPVEVTDAFAVGDADGAHEIGLADLSGTGAAGMGPTIVDLATCTIIEANVLIGAATSWRYEVPWVYGELYYNTNSVVAGERYLREVIVHELGHNLSLAHTTDSYDFMNGGSSTSHARAWANRQNDDQRIEPLPDMRRALRDLYPGTASETDIGVLVTWFDDSTGDSPAPQKLLCKPSGGIGFSPGLFDEHCGVNVAGAAGPTQVCPGDTLYTRFAIPNYGNVDLSPDMELWFSADDVLDRNVGSGDIRSATVVAHTVSASSSARIGVRFTVPAGLTPGGTYYPIIFANTGNSLALEENERNNWIPLRTPITICP